MGVPGRYRRYRPGWVTGLSNTCWPQSAGASSDHAIWNSARTTSTFAAERCGAGPTVSGGLRATSASSTVARRDDSHGRIQERCCHPWSNHRRDGRVGVPTRSAPSLRHPDSPRRLSVRDLDVRWRAGRCSGSQSMETGLGGASPSAERASGWTPREKHLTAQAMRWPGRECGQAPLGWSRW